MKLKKHIGALIFTSILAVGATSCNDFAEINTNPADMGEQYARPDYVLNKAIKGFQQNPHYGERLYPYNFASVSRIVGDNTTAETGRYSDEFNGCMYDICSNSIKYATQSITVSENNEPLFQESEKPFYNNVRQFARIWRALVIADFADCFGPYPLNAFQGENPTFNSVEEVYDFILKEVAEASAAIDLTAEPTELQAKGDPAFKYNAAKWQKLANSLRMRWAMRLSEVNESKARQEFEAAAKLPYLTEKTDLFAFQENGGWSDWEGVYNRVWLDNILSSTMANLMAGLGDVNPQAVRPEIPADKVKPLSYLGLRFANHYSVNTDNPTNTYFLDGVPEALDPRGLVIFALPTDKTAPNYPDQAVQTDITDHAKDHRYMADPEHPDDETKRIYVDAAYAWNGAMAGARSAWLQQGNWKHNILMNNSWEACPFLGKEYRDNSIQRVFFGPWEAYFLIAEGAVRGWTTPIDGKTAYENGIRASFQYFSTIVPGMDISSLADSYIASENYNRVGTSVSWDHTAEPQSFQATYVDGYTNETKTIDYAYPDATKILYKNKKLNDKLTKIITQKYIANTPYVAIESWNDRRRLGLPFFEVAPIETDALSGSDKNGLIKPTDYKAGQTWKFFSQRMRYPSSLEIADAAEFNHALQLMNATENTMMTPLWWAMK